MYQLHSIASLLHGCQGFPVDVGSFYGVHLLLERHDVTKGLVEVALVELLPSKSGFGGCNEIKTLGLGRQQWLD